MNTKINITQKLKNDIIESRKREGISAYDLSERSGHSKFWLSNIEGGKTKKITVSDLYSIYKIIHNTDDDDDVTFYIENVLNQQVGNEQKEWFELIEIADEFTEEYDEDVLMDKLDELLDDKLIPTLRNSVFGMSINQKQAALTAVQNLYYSLYKDPDLAFALINIPIYGVKELDISEHNGALNDLLAISAKYNDLVIKNSSRETIKGWNERDEYYRKLNKKNIHIAYHNFKLKLKQIVELSKTENPDWFHFANQFNTDVSFIIERGQPNALKHYLKSYSIYDGKGLEKHIKECVKWFVGFENEYDLPYLYNEISSSTLEQIYNYLNKLGEFKRYL